jgi:putative lipoic acid-binding regulatory protein
MATDAEKLVQKLIEAGLKVGNATSVTIKVTVADAEQTEVVSLPTGA